MKACVSYPPITEKQGIIYLKNVWEGMGVARLIDGMPDK